MSEKKVVGRNVAIALGIICIVLAVSLVGVIANYTSIINNKDKLYNDYVRARKSVSIDNIGVFWNQWKIFPQQNSSVHYAIADFEVVNYGEVSALVLVAVEVRHEENVLYEFFKTDEGSGVYEPIVRYGYFMAPSGAKNCSLTFGYQNPENLDTYLFIKVAEAFPIG